MTENGHHTPSKVHCNIGKLENVRGGRYSNVAHVLVGRRGKAAGGEAILASWSVILSQGVFKYRGRANFSRVIWTLAVGVRMTSSDLVGWWFWGVWGGGRVWCVQTTVHNVSSHHHAKFQDLKFDAVSAFSLVQGYNTFSFVLRTIVVYSYLERCPCLSRTSCWWARCRPSAAAVSGCGFRPNFGHMKLFFLQFSLCCSCRVVSRLVTRGDCRVGSRLETMPHSLAHPVVIRLSVKLRIALVTSLSHPSLCMAQGGKCVHLCT